MPEAGSSEALREAYDERRPLLVRLAERLEREVLRQLEGVPHIDRVSFRAKGTESFVKKVIERRTDPAYEEPLIEVEDQVAGRIIVFFLSDVVVARRTAERLFTPVEATERKPAKFNEFDYESFHGIYAIPSNYEPEGWTESDMRPATFELQVRTLFQHAYAEPQHDVAYKPVSSLTVDDRRELAWVAANAWGADQAIERVAQRLGVATKP